MLIKRKDEDGRIIAYIEWVRLDKDNIPDDNGDYVFVRYAWVHKDFRHKEMLQNMFMELCNNTPGADYVYWEKHKCGDKLEMAPKEYLIKKGVKDGKR